MTKKIVKGISNGLGAIGLFAAGIILGKTYEERHQEEHEKLTDGTIDDTESSVE